MYAGYPGFCLCFHKLHNWTEMLFGISQAIPKRKKTFPHLKMIPPQTPNHISSYFKSLKISPYPIPELFRSHAIPSHPKIKTFPSHPIIKLFQNSSHSKFHSHPKILKMAFHPIPNSKKFHPISSQNFWNLIASNHIPKLSLFPFVNFLSFDPICKLWDILNPIPNNISVTKSKVQTLLVLVSYMKWYVLYSSSSDTCNQNEKKR